MTVALSSTAVLRTSIIWIDSVGDFIVIVRCVLFGHFGFAWGKCAQFVSHNNEFSFIYTFAGPIAKDTRMKLTGKCSNSVLWTPISDPIIWLTKQSVN
jgi:hypothetical protein